MADVKTKITIVDNASVRLNKINRSVQDISKSFTVLSRQNRAFVNNLNAGSIKATQIANSLNGVNIKATAASNSVSKASTSVKHFSQSALDAEHSTNLLISKLRRLASIYLGVMGAKAALATSDSLTSAENRFGNLAYTNGMTDSTSRMNFSQESLDKIFSASQRAASGYHEMDSNVSKAVTLAGSAFGKSLEQQVDNAIVFQEIMAKSYALAGASAAEQASSMYQLNQALGSGILQGDELRSVREGAPLAYKAIEEFAQGVLHSDKALKDLASEGLITSNIVIAAILDMEDKTNKSFSNIEFTFAQLWTMFMNDTKKAFEPFLRTLRRIANSDAIKTIGLDVTQLMWMIGSTLNGVATVIETAINFIAQNWTFFRAILIGITSVVMVLVISALITAAQSAITFAMALITANIPAIVLVASLMLLVYWIYLMATASGDVANSIGRALLYIAGILAIIAAVAMVTGATLGFGLSAPMLFFIAILALVVAAFLMFTEEIVGTAFWLGATLWNAIVALINGFLQLMYTKFVEPFIRIIEFVLNVFQGGFDNFGDMVANLIGQIISWFLSLGKVVTTIIDAIFGTDWTSGLSDLQAKVTSWGKNENAITLDTNIPEDVLLKRIDATDAYDKGAAIGAGWHNSINDWFGNQFGALNEKLNGLNNTNAKASGVEDLLAGINEDTGSISKKMDLTEEDLRFLRQLAEQEAINKFTTAEIKVDMVNQNNISKETDMDAVMSHFKTVMENELAVLADGVHI